MELTIKEYIQSKESLDAKIAAIELLIDDMIVSMAEGIGNSGTASYSIDDGQMKVMTQYRSVNEIANGVRALEKTLQMYMNRRNGSVTILRGKLNY
jgi:hypothetical protein